MSTIINLKRAQQRSRRLGAIEASLRREYFTDTESVIGLFSQAPGEAEKAMRSETLWEKPRSGASISEAAKLYDAETGKATEAIKAKPETEEDEYPCLRCVGIGFLVAMLICIACHAFALYCG